MIKDNHGQAIKVNIYPVGFYRDVNEYLIRKFRPRLFLRWFMSSNKRGSYWNGFLAEPYKMPEGYRKCGSGLIPILALWSLYKRTDGQMTATDIVKESHVSE